ncbi:peptidylprolyl isomerase [Aquihabitans sp. G128]|uniref:peptidylprolyl isomerase n=1 Tax=Aquihabitans sp. G128 TaxID=2849779 RepID=UPI001C251094|nr:peptidylprolyl isomerase [Aquihabitans sp. G128]QXC60040.1 peptidylprolyl isomerase [Aquihabitans sp. G128]
MGTEKRERQKANREARLAAEAAAEARKRRIRFIRNAVILTIVIIAVGFALAGCSSDSSDGTVAAGDGEASTSAAYGTGDCPPEGGSAKPVVTFTVAPKKCIDLAKTYTAAVTTTEGSFSLRFDTKRTPLTTNNFVVLARYGYFDGTDLFRTEAGSGIIQGGSPHTQDNSDPGPGYTIPDEGLPFSSADYAAGTIAMARTSAPNSASGQFFLLANEGGAYLGDKAQLGPDAGSYAVFGTVTEGIDVLEKIAALDTGAGAPSKQVTIQKVAISES